MANRSDKPITVGPINGLNASTVHLLTSDGPNVLDALCVRFPTISRAQWESRFARGRVLDLAGDAVPPTRCLSADVRLHYYREVDTEIVIPFAETLVHVDADLVIADKPHFLPVTPSGRHVEQTLLARLIHALSEPDLVPLHRIDAATAGLVMFSRNPATRSAYQALFREHRIDKRYEALAAPLPDLDFPLVRRSRIVKGEPFFRMAEAEGEPNSETHIDVIERGSTLWRYALAPITGKQHQLRVHMAALGAPLLNDDFYPTLAARPAEQFDRPLQLLAQSLRFVDPLTGIRREYASRQYLLAMTNVVS